MDSNGHESKENERKRRLDENLEFEPDHDDTLQKTTRDDKRRWKVWTHEEIIILIEIWTNYDILYNIKNPEHYSKTKKMDALRSICTDLKEKDVIATTDEIQSKLNSLRIYYCSQRSKIDRSMQNGGAHNAYIVRWPYYEYLGFLEKNLTPRKRNSKHSNHQTVNQATTDISEGPSFVENAHSTRSENKSQTTSVNNKSRIIETAKEMPTITLERIASENEKSNDEKFCDMLCSLLQKMGEGSEKEFLKLELHRQVLNAYYKKSYTFEPHKTD